jgi:MFS family permease
MAIFRDLHHDAKLLMVSRGIRAFAFSYLNVVFAIYLDRLCYSPVTIGIVYSVAYLSGAVLTAVWGYLSDRYGRRKILMLLALLTIVSTRSLFFSSLFFILRGHHRQRRCRWIGWRRLRSGRSIPWKKPCWRKVSAENRNQILH